MIVNEGNEASREQLGVETSTVFLRELDFEPWFVHRYDDATGECRIVRGIRPTDDLAGRDSLTREGFRGPDDAVQLRAIRERRGQGAFREMLLSAWSRRCVVTECHVVELLEAAHIVPHAAETDYRTSNGLLLRADIHTLFDLRLLSIDSYFRVYLAPPLLNSEYAKLHGKRIERRPKSADAPSPEALQRRHESFIQAQKDAA